MTQSNVYGSSSAGPTAGAVREETANVGQTAADAGNRVAGTAVDQGKQVVSETTRQARNLAGEASGQLRGQASVQQRRAAGALHTLADDLRSMATHGQRSGVAGELVHQASDRTHQVASWLENREPEDILTDVRGYARRHPGAFLAGAAVAGAVIGRLARNLASGNRGGVSGGSGYTGGNGFTGGNYAGGAGTVPAAQPDAGGYGGGWGNGSAAGYAAGSAQVPQGGYAETGQGGYTGEAGGLNRPASGYDTAPAGGTAQPGAYDAAPAGGTAQPGGYDAAPAGGTAQPGGYDAAPAGYLAGDLPVDEPVPGGAGTTYRSEAGR